MNNVGLVSLVLICFASCSGNDVELEVPPGYEKVISPNFIQGYFIPDSVTIDEYPEAASHSADNEMLEIHFWGMSVDERSHPELFEYYAGHYGDRGYGRYLQPGSNLAVAEAFRKISVISDTDFDSGHPAGTPLDELVCLRSESAYEYIRSGYKNDCVYVNCRKPLNLLGREDMTLMRYTTALKKKPWDKKYYAWGGYNISGLKEDRYNNLTLSFLKYPDKSAVHKLKFTFEKADGTRMVTECKVDFEAVCSQLFD